MLVHWLWFSLLPGLNGRKKLEILHRCPNPEDLYHSQRRPGLPDEIQQILQNKDLTQAKQIMKQCAEKGISIVTFSDSNFPDRLRRIDDPPMVLYCKGVIPAWDLQPTIGVVGTRSASPYGLRSAGKLSAQIAACGGIVVSGGAFGIDSMALRGALECGGTTIAFMAGGLDKLYPAANSPLFAQIMEKGCLLSEYPPGTAAYRGNFLRRNRLISGISNGLLVVEAPKISGALNTARWANEQGRDVFVVPGNIDVESCEGSNALIGDIARSVSDGWSILREYAYAYPETVKEVKIQWDSQRFETGLAQPIKNAPKEKADKKIVDKKPDCPYSVKETPVPPLNPDEQAVFSLLTPEPVPVDSLLDRLDMAPSQVLNIITRLSVKGVVQNHPGKNVSAKHGG